MLEAFSQIVNMMAERSAVLDKFAAYLSCVMTTPDISSCILNATQIDGIKEKCLFTLRDGIAAIDMLNTNTFDLISINIHE